MATESEIERDLIDKLVELKYTRRDDIRDKAVLEQNFREKFEALNRVSLSDAEFARLRDGIIAADTFVAAQTLRERNTFQRDDGTPLQYTLVNIGDWCKNEYEVVNQLRINTENSHHRYDVILLINGLPVVQIELKALTISPRRAMEQIVNYKNDPGNGYTNSLLCFMQIFIVSNRSDTWYFANNQSKHFAFHAEERFLPVYQLAGRDNRKITHLDDFAGSFLEKCALGEMISRYMVLVASEQKLLIMRPYQIYAVKAIVECIRQNRGNGYIWHTTGSGKTLTSFKASTLLKDNPDIQKCLFVVDRKDLDRHTRMEFNKFQEGCVEENTNTETLVRRLMSEDYADKVIVTTIQKLGLALGVNGKAGKRSYKERLEPLRDQRVVFVFDECHRSQFGENHKAIKAFFPNAQLFGFTGTPIFEENSSHRQVDGTMASYQITEDIFQKLLHDYTITHAIDDGNVLRFHIDYLKPESGSANGSGANTKLESLAQPDETQARKAVVEAILDKHNAATDNRRFNAILATASINDAISYHALFDEVQKERRAANESFAPLNVACVFSPPAAGDRDVEQLQEDLPQERADNEREPQKKKQALNAIIDDYNNLYHTNHSINEFDGYFGDVQQRIKDHKYPNRDLPREKKIDVTIVVDMLLTGFDSQYLNTLYVDKNLKHHGLIQAFSRTNRVLNDTKPWGNVLDFRGQQRQVDAAVTLFSGSHKGSPREIWLVDPAPKVIEKLKFAVTGLQEFMDGQGLRCAPEEVANLKGDTARAGFVNRFKEVQRLMTQVDQYTDLDEQQRDNVENLLPQEQMRSFRGVYLEMAKRLRERQVPRGGEADEETRQLDFEFVLFSSALIDYDYIMDLIAQYSQGKPARQQMTREQIVSMLGSNSNLMDERDDMIAFIDTLMAGEGLSEQAIREGYEAFKARRSVNELAELAANHGLEADALQTFVNGTLSRMIFDGQKLTELLEPLELGWMARTKKELALMEELVPFLKKQAQGREISGLAVYE